MLENSHPPASIDLFAPDGFADRVDACLFGELTTEFPTNRVAACHALDGLMDEIHAADKAAGELTPTLESWISNRTVPTILAELHSEISFAMGAFRNAEKDVFTHALAELVAKVLSASKGLGLELTAAIFDVVDDRKKASAAPTEG